MTTEELIREFNDFINENSLWSDFIYFIEKKGYTENECDEVIEKATR